MSTEETKTVQLNAEDSMKANEAAAEQRAHEDDAPLTEEQQNNVRIAEETKKGIDTMLNQRTELIDNRIAFLKDFRADVRGIENAIRDGVTLTPNTSEARKKCVEARHWAGKMLGVLGTMNPYKDENGNDKKEIVPTVDSAKEEKSFLEEQSNTERIQELRVMLEHLNHKFESNNPIGGPIESWFGNLVMVKLAEARMWLGEALAE